MFYRILSPTINFPIFHNSTLRRIYNLFIAKEKSAIQKEFDALVKAGDNQLASGNFDAAIAKYEEAKLKMPGNQTAADKIKEANQKKADAAAASTSSGAAP